MFSTMFAGPFREGTSARVEMPEDPDVVEAVLRHTYTGVLPPVDCLQALALAHRLGVEECAAASAADDTWDDVEAVRVLAPLLNCPAVSCSAGLSLRLVDAAAGRCRRGALRARRRSMSPQCSKSRTTRCRFGAWI